jgi:CubicO group peptidase (beta-lactamase class C family)
MTTTAVEIHGQCDDRFALVRDEFIRNFEERGDIGAACSIVIDGEPIVDLWAGWLDEDRTRPWERDAILNIYSIGKAMTGIAVLRLVDEGRVDLEEPAATYWPEFSQGGKGDMPLRLLLTHQTGLIAVRKPLPSGSFLDWDLMTSELAAQEPWWTPGEGHGYHTNTYGFLGGEIVRRVDGRSLGTYFREEIAEPLGAELLIGFGPEYDHRTADSIPYRGEQDPNRRPWLDQDPDTLEGLELGRYLAYRNPPPKEDGSTGVNTRAWRAAEYPSTNPHGNARGVARLFGALARGGDIDGFRVLSAATIDRANTIEADGEDLVLGRPTRFGLGFQLTMPGIRPLGPNPKAFGHYGASALIGFADPDEQLGFAYLCNQGGRSWRDPRNIALIDATYASL